MMVLYDFFIELGSLAGTSISYSERCFYEVFTMLVWSFEKFLACKFKLYSRDLGYFSSTEIAVWTLSSTVGEMMVTLVVLIELISLENLGFG